LFIRGLQGIEHGRNFGMIETSGELRVLDLVKKNFKDPVIFDGGANVGEYARVAGAVGTVYAFEPASSPFSTLQKNFEGVPNVKPFQYALSRDSQTMTLKSDQEGSLIASVVNLNYEHYNIAMDREEKVEGITIDAFCKKWEVDRINLLKLDIEGSEYFALLGAKDMIASDKIDLIQFEMGWPNVDSKTFFKDFYLLLKEKYKLYRILSFGLVPIQGYFYEYEIFLGCNYLAIRKDLDLNTQVS
jgi:FkbM family methyltransferase